MIKFFLFIFQLMFPHSLQCNGWCKDLYCSIAPCTTFCWLLKRLSDKHPSFNKAHTKARCRKGGDLQDELQRLFAHTRRQTLMTSESCTAPVNHPRDFLLIYGFGPVDKTAGDGLLEKLKGQTTKINSACFLRGFLLDNMKQIHHRQHHQFKTPCLVSETTP